MASPMPPPPPVTTARPRGLERRASMCRPLQPEEVDGVVAQDPLLRLVAHRQAFEVRLVTTQVESIRAVQDLVATARTIHELEQFRVERRGEVRRDVAVDVGVTPDHRTELTGPGPACVGQIDLQ